jgi:Fe-Mn family superoxide dismutase
MSVQSTIASLPVAFLDKELSASPAEVPPLPYGYDALERAIDAETMQLHHDRHHTAYVNNLNAALDKHPELKNRSVESLLRDLSSIPEDIRTTVRNNGGGHLNHSMFWYIMSPNGGGEPTGSIAEEINQTFGSWTVRSSLLGQTVGDKKGHSNLKVEGMSDTG